MKISFLAPLLKAFNWTLLLVVLSSCAGGRVESQASLPKTLPKPSALEIPKWYSDFLDVFPECDTRLLCVLGEGDTLVQAEQEARANAAKFFSTKINASTNVSSQSEQKSDSPIGDFSEWASKSIKEETSEIINGLSTKQQAEVNGRFYLIMSLNRQKAAEGLKEKIQSLDLENLELLKLSTRFAYPRILRNLTLSRPLLDRYALLSSEPLKPQVTTSSMLETIARLSPLKLLIVHKAVAIPQQLGHTLNEMLAPLKIITAKRGEAGIQQTLVTDFVTEDLYFKVEGFKRLNVLLKLELQNPEGEVIGRLSASSEQTARSKEQAMAAALPILKELLLENFNQLGHVTQNR